MALLVKSLAVASHACQSVGSGSRPTPPAARRRRCPAFGWQRGACSQELGIGNLELVGWHQQPGQTFATFDLVVGDLLGERVAAGVAQVFEFLPPAAGRRPGLLRDGPRRALLLWEEVEHDEDGRLGTLVAANAPNERMQLQDTLVSLAEQVE